jgi:transcriptional regulator with XRE-family HTH domain
MSYDTPNTSEIKNTRLRAKLAQEDCAHLCCVTVKTWARWETGKTPMSAGMWKLFIIELERIENLRRAKDNEVNEAEVVDLKQISNGWDLIGSSTYLIGSSTYLFTLSGHCQVYPV